MLTLVGLIPGQKLARAAVTSGFVYVNLYPMLDPEYRVRPGDAVMLRRELSIYLEGRKFHDFMRQ